MVFAAYASASLAFEVALIILTSVVFQFFTQLSATGVSQGLL